MLILTRKPGERIFINDDIIITILNSTSGQVRIGIDAPVSMSVHREEIYEKIKREGFINKNKVDLINSEGEGNV